MVDEITSVDGINFVRNGYLISKNKQIKFRSGDVIAMKDGGRIGLVLNKLYGFIDRYDVELDRTPNI